MSGQRMHLLQNLYTISLINIGTWSHWSAKCVLLFVLPTLSSMANNGETYIAYQSGEPLHSLCTTLVQLFDMAALVLWVFTVDHKINECWVSHWLLGIAPSTEQLQRHLNSCLIFNWVWFIDSTQWIWSFITILNTSLLCIGLSQGRETPSHWYLTCWIHVLKFKVNWFSYCRSVLCIVYYLPVTSRLFYFSGSICMHSCSMECAFWRLLPCSFVMLITMHDFLVSTFGACFVG